MVSGIQAVSDDTDWQDSKEHPPCLHARLLREFLVANGFFIWGSFTEDPDGWVNVVCDRCNDTYSMLLIARMEPE